MTDEEYVFKADVIEKKRTAVGAKNRVVGSRGGMKMPSDYLSKAQKKKLSGEVLSFKMNEPVAYKKFKKWPKGLQKDYIVGLIERFNAPRRAIGRMFGVGDGAMKALFDRLEIPTVAGRQNDWKEQEFEDWRAGKLKIKTFRADAVDGEDVDEYVEEVTEVEVEPEKAAEEVVEVPAIKVDAEDDTESIIKRGMDIFDIVRALKSMGCKASISITIET